MGIGILSIPVLAGELLYFDKHNRKHEQQAAAAFRARELPKGIQRKLKSRFFH